MRIFYTLLLSILLIGCSKSTQVEENRVSCGKIIDVKISVSDGNTYTAITTESNIISFYGRLSVLPKNEKTYIIYMNDGSKWFTWDNSPFRYCIW